MKRTTVRWLAVGMAAAWMAAAMAPPAYAIKPFFLEFQAKYVKPKSRKPADVALGFAVEQAGCTICHPGDDTHRLTAYGGKIAMRINKFDQKDKKRIQAAFDEVAALKSDPHDPKALTYRELFRQGKLPPVYGQ